MNQQDAIEFITLVFGEGTPSNQGLNYSVICPICNKNNDGLITKKKLAIRTTDFACHCWVCGYKSRTIKWLLYRFYKNFLHLFFEKFPEQLENIISNQSVLNHLDEEEEDIKIELPIGSQLIAPEYEKFAAGQKISYHAYKAITYLNSRNISAVDCWIHKLCYTETDDKMYNHRIIFPSFSRQGSLEFYTTRTWSKFKKPKYFNPPFKRREIIFNEININWNEEITLVEGPFDLIKVNRNASCLLGSNMNKTDKLFQKIVENQTPVLLALDNDVKQKQIEIANTLNSYCVPVRILELPKTLKDVGELKSKKDFLELRKEATINYTPNMFFTRGLIANY